MPEDPLANILRSKRETTRFQVLVEIAEHQPSIRQQEIADKLGYKNHSGINKRIKKMREKYMEFDPDFKYWERKKTSE